ncbi:MAG TPA: twin-arginine translocase TatA/TatE family subunit, partial [Trebonia sp.]
MFGLGWPEIIALVVIALLVFGPEKLPQAASQAGRT